MGRHWIIAVALVCALRAEGGRLPTSATADTAESPTSSTAEKITGADVEALRMKKRFGIGVGAAGPLSGFGLRAEVNATENLSIGIGYGTGGEFTTWMAEARLFLLGNWVSPFIGVGIARWFSDGTKDKQVGPSITRYLLRPEENPANGFSMVLAYPAIGVQFMHPAGFALSFELEQMFRLFSMGNGTYGGVSFHWYM